MFGKRLSDADNKSAPPSPAPSAAAPAAAGATGKIPDLNAPQAGAQAARPGGAQAAAPGKKPDAAFANKRSENYYDIKSTIFNALIDAIDLTQLGQLDRDAARDEIRDIDNEIITLKDVVMSIAEQEELLETFARRPRSRSARARLATTSPTSWSTAATRPSSNNGKMQKTGVASATMPSFSTSASASSARSAAASTKPARYATPVSWTARASTSSPRRWPSMDRRSPSASSRRTG
jgi:pilus assembly protein CpaF